MGDLNAACSYVRDTDWPNIRLASDKRFWWLIDDCQDTTLLGSRCAYDRYITILTSFSKITNTDLIYTDSNKSRFISICCHKQPIKE